MSTKSSHKSPRARTPRTVPEPSPARVTRLEEKQELQELNQRLEFYIIKNREKDANKGILEREVEDARDRFEADLKHAEELYQQQLNDVRKARDEEKLANARLNAELKQTAQERDQAHAELDQLHVDQGRLSEDNEELQKELASKNVECAQARDLLESTKSQLTVAQSKVEALSTDLNSSREAEANADQRAQVAESKLKAIQDDYDTSNNKQSAEIKRLRREVDDLSRKNAHIEEELRRELTTQLGEIIAKRQAEWEQDKNDGLAELKALYDEKIRAYRDHLERAGHELEMLKSQRAAAVKEVELTKTAAEEFESVKALLKKRIAELEETVQMERARPVRELAEKNEIIRRLKAAFKRKDEEFDQLMDTKIALAMEIRAYRQMLDKEELRLGYKSPVAGNKKRKLVTEEEEEDSELETNATQDEDGSTLMFTKYDLDGQCITIRNSSLNSISLEGWSVRSRATGNEFKLPADLTLASGQSTVLWTGEDASQHHSPPEGIAWVAPAPVWDDVKGDTAELLDPDHQLVSSKDLVGQHPAMDADGEPVNQNGQKCLIM